LNNFKSGFVTIIGRPNVGKSTLMNQLIGQKIAIMSDKPQTTRNTIQTIITTEEGQIVFIDTPGIHKPKHKLGEFMNKSAQNTFRQVDVILWLVEPDMKIGKGDEYIIEQLEKIKTPVILIINKIDTISKDKILEVIATYKDAYNFAEIIPVSALTGDNTKEIPKLLLEYLEEGPQFFSEDMITDQPERQLVAELIREKALHLLQQEIPHGIAVVIDRMKNRDNKDIVDIDATIICEKDSHKGIIIGKQGSMLKQIGSNARKDIENLLGSKVNLQIWVKIKNNWRDSDFLLKNYGFNKDETN
jgi:GTP-binding protein Era